MANRSVRRSELIHEMERLYSDRAYSDIEMAARMEVDRSTIYRTRTFMERELNIPFLREEPGRYRLDRHKQLGSIRLSQMEALALYLGGRRLQQQTRIAHLPTASALEKLANVLRQPMMTNLGAPRRRFWSRKPTRSRPTIWSKSWRGGSTVARCASAIGDPTPIQPACTRSALTSWSRRCGAIASI